MECSLAVQSFSQEKLFTSVIKDLVKQGWSVQQNSLPEKLLQDLVDEINYFDNKQLLLPAAIGRRHQKQFDQSIRSDRTLWLDGRSKTQLVLLDFLEAFRLNLNEQLWLGLDEVECHYAIYDKGSFYKRHLDAFNGHETRVVSVVFYLNKDWQEVDGGSLKLYSAKDIQAVSTVLPERGTCVCFMSSEIPHEVLPSFRSRMSIAGWFRRQSTIEKRFGL
ncbi:2OG-Fe(II) oxygenase [Zooshikella sp. RANM57]|uniref:2OG-Fe(II) oxygenase n=1 Tax=Zooshikella sp. RANM57 TaxID=3425863 RepID=UPI003D6F5444